MTLGIGASTYTTPRDTMVVVFGGTSGASVGSQLILNNTSITVGGAGAQSDAIIAINNANLAGIVADKNANGNLVVTCWIPQNPGGLIVAEPSGATTLSQLGLTAGTFWPPTPPKGFATAYGELSSPICITTNQISMAATDLAGNNYGPVTVTLNGGSGSGLAGRRCSFGSGSADQRRLGQHRQRPVAHRAAGYPDRLDARHPGAIRE